MENVAMKPGHKTTEFWGKTVLQFMLVLAVLFPGMGFEMEEQTAMVIAAGLEALYNTIRGVVKGIDSLGPKGGSTAAPPGS